MDRCHLRHVDVFDALEIVAFLSLLFMPDNRRFIDACLQFSSVTDRSKKRAQTDACRAQRIALVNFEHCVEFACGLENPSDLLRSNRIKPAAETHKLH